MASGVLVGLGGGRAATLAAGVVAGLGAVFARRAVVVAVAAGLAASVAAVGSSGANDGSLTTLAKAGLYGLAVAIAVGAAAVLLARGSRPRSAVALAATAVLLTAGTLGARALPSPPLRMNGTSDRAAVAAGMSPEKVARMDRFVRTELTRNHMPGAAFSVVSNGRAVLERGYGVAGPDRRPMTPRTPQIIASLSKSMAAVAFATLVEQGKASFDEPVRTYLPWFRVAEPGPSKTITVRQLLNQTSGLDSSSDWGTMARSTGRTLEGEVRSMRNVPLAFRPGRGFAYSNQNYQTVGLIVQVVSGQPYGRYLEDHVLRPAHMSSTFAARYSPGAVAPAYGNRGWFGVPVAMKQPFIPAAVPSGSVYSTAHDLGLYLQSHLGRADLAAVSPSTYATLHQPVRGYGMGWFEGRTSPGATPALVHSGHGPGATSMVTVDPAAGWGIAVIANHQELGQITADDLGRGLSRIMAGRGTPAVHTRVKTHVVLGLIAVAVFALLARAVSTLGRWRRGRRRAITVARIAWVLVCGLGCVAGTLFVTGAHARGGETARTAIVYAPDVTLLALTAVGGLFVLTVVRAGLLVRRH